MTSSLIIVSVVVPILITVVILVMVFRKVGSISGNSKLLQTGIPGTAQITAVQQGNMVVNMTNYECHFVMNINLPGEAPYEAVLTQLVPMMVIPRVQPGMYIAVKVDPADRSKAVIDWNTPVQVAPSAAVPSAAMVAGAVGAAAAVAGPGNVPVGGSAAELLQSGQRVLGVLQQFADTGNTARSMGITPSKPQYADDPMYALTLELHLGGPGPVTAQVIQRVPRVQVPNLTAGWQLNCAVNPSNPTQEVAVDWGD